MTNQEIEAARELVCSYYGFVYCVGQPIEDRLPGTRTLFDLALAAITKSRPRQEKDTAGIITALIFWLEGSLKCESHPWEPDQREIAQQTIKEACFFVATLQSK